MKKQQLTRDNLIALMKSRQGARTQREFSVELGISEQFLSDIYAGHRDPGPDVLGKLGLSRTVVYQKVEAAQ